MTVAGFDVRRAQPSDLAGAGDLAALMVRLHHRWDSKRFAILGDDIAPGYTDWLGQESHNKRALVLVAVTRELPAKVIGYAYARLEGRDWWKLRDAAGVLHDLVVDEAWRKRGVGSALMDAVVAWMREHRAPRLIIETAAANTVGQAFFRKHGFRQTQIEMTRELRDDSD